jgi:hypothetical protein
MCSRLDWPHNARHRFIELLVKEKWALNYHMSDFGSGHAPGGLLVLSKIPLESVSYYERTEPGQVSVRLPHVSPC